MSLSQEKELMFMRYTITGRNIEVTPGLKAAVEKKIGKLEHFFNAGHRSNRKRLAHRKTEQKSR